MTSTKPILLSLFLALFCLPMLAARGQDAAAQEDAAEEAAADAEQLGVKQLRELVSAGQLDEAAELLEQLVADPTQVDEAQSTRQLLASMYGRQRKYAEATAQMQKLFDYQLQQTQTAADAVRLARYAQMLNSYAGRANQSDAAQTATEQALARCQKLATGNNADQLLEPITQLLSSQAVNMAQAGQAEQARERIGDEAKRLAQRIADGGNSEPVAYAHISLLTLLASRGPLGAGDEASAAQLDAALDAALDAFPESRRLRMQYANSEGMRIASSYRDDPDAAAERIAKVLDRLSKYSDDDKNLAGMLSRIRSYESRIAAAKKQVEMIGKPAPALQIDAWANTADGTTEGLEDSLKGKVVLYDFWAVWCGPCIATFPHLRQWRAEFGDQGFEVVGITRYYGYEWDDEAGRATRGEDVQPETERQAITKFLQSKDMQHPTIFTPQDSTLQKEYGVTGIPHAVLIDRQGNVQMIKVGSGSANAEAIHEKIKELIAE